MEKEQLLKMVEQVRKTCEDNGITVLMIVGNSKGNTIDSTNLLRDRKGTLISMIAGFMNESSDFSDIILNASEHYVVHQQERLRKSLVEDLENFYKEFTNHRISD